MLPTDALCTQRSNNNSRAFKGFLKVGGARIFLKSSDRKDPLVRTSVEFMPQSANEFASQDLDQVKTKFPQALGVAAGCGVLEKPSVKN